MTNDQTVTQALEPCPFCGGEAAFKSGFTDGRDVGRAYCTKCGATAHPFVQPKAETITAWNTRTAHSGEGRSNDDVLRCDDCGCPNPVWFAPSDVWNLVVGGPDATDDPGGVLCPICFIAKAEEAGVKPNGWRIEPEGRSNGAGEVEGIQSSRIYRYWPVYRSKVEGDPTARNWPEWAKGRVAILGYREQGFRVCEQTGGKTIGSGEWGDLLVEYADGSFGVLAALSAPQGEVDRLDAENDRLRAGLENIIGTWERNKTEAGDDWQEGYEDALAECARQARAALAQPEAGGER